MKADGKELNGDTPFGGALTKGRVTAKNATVSVSCTTSISMPGSWGQLVSTKMSICLHHLKCDIAINEVNWHKRMKSSGSTSGSISRNAVYRHVKLVAILRDDWFYASAGILSVPAVYEGLTGNLNVVIEILMGSR